MSDRQRLTNRDGQHFTLEVDGLRYTATIGPFADGRVAEIFIQNHKSNSGAETGARDAAIACSFALQYGADMESIRKALCGDSHGRTSGVLGAALDLIVGGSS